MPRFGDLEAAIMDEVWAAGEPVKVRDVLESLAPQRTLAYTTVQTVMDVLVRKSWLVRTKVGRANTYLPTGTRADYVGGLLSEALAHADDRTGALMNLVERLDRVEVDDLSRQIAAARRRAARQ